MLPLIVGSHSRATWKKTQISQINKGKCKRKKTGTTSSERKIENMCVCVIKGCTLINVGSSSENSNDDDNDKYDDDDDERN